MDFLKKNSGLFFALIITLCLFVVFPILSMMNCSGNEGMGITSCSVDFKFLRNLAEIYYGLIFISIFTGLIPFYVYLFVFICLISSIIKSHKKEKSSTLFKITLVFFIIFYSFVIFVS
ncbi:MAG: hypothetical protein ACK5N8_03355 [Alphaproteobacteria bacterium]